MRSLSAAAASRGWDTTSSPGSAVTSKRHNFAIYIALFRARKTYHES